MTHLIQPWHQLHHVRALQTTNQLAQYPTFDVHPAQSQTDAMHHLVEQFNLPHTPVFLQQMHEAVVIEYTAVPAVNSVEQADACFTRKPGVVCAVMSADCLPVLLTDTNGSFVAAIHCGWRGLFHKIIAHTVTAIKPNAPVMAWLGPCIQSTQYEVDDNFVHRYLQQHPKAESAFTPIIKGKSQANLYQMAQLQLQQLGINQIRKDGTCTYLSPEYYSWRQNQCRHRMGSMIWMDRV